MYIQEEKNKIPTIKIIILLVFLACVAIILMTFSDGISGNDFWWHIKVGEWICENGRVPTNDIFSWYGMENELPWTAHEWLADVIYYLIYHFTGELGVFLFAISAALTMLIFMLSHAKIYLKDNILIGSLFFIFLSVVFSLFFYGRPHVFSFFLLFFELKILYRFMEVPDTKLVFLLPIIGCLWSNLHGGSSNLAYLLCIVFLIGSLFEFKIGRIYGKRQEQTFQLKLIGITVLTFLSLLLNPIGIHVIVFPYTSIGDTLMMSAISEWQAPDAKVFGQLLFYFIPIILMTIGIVAKETKIRIIDILVMGMFLYLFFRSARFIMLWYIAACFYAFPYMPKCEIKEIQHKAEKILLAVAVLLLLILIGVGGYNICKIEEDAYISKVMCDEAIEAVKNHSTERMFNDYNLGEALIYNDIPVFFDARADMYLQRNIFADGISLISLNQKNTEAETEYVDVDYLIEKYGFDSILILKERPLYTYISSHQEMVECIYEDEELVYYRILKHGE